MDKDYNSKDMPLKVVNKGKPSYAKKSGAFDKVKILFPFFNEKRSIEAKLVGRVHPELQKNAREILAQLKTLKENLKEELILADGQLWSSFEAVINPLIREFSQIERKIEGVDPTQWVEKSYEEWIFKAKAWVSLSGKPNAKRKIIEAVIQHSLHVSDDVINRDLKMLHDYKLHEIYNLGLDFDEIKAAVARLDKELLPHVNGLLNLKDLKPQELELRHLSQWKAKLDEDRALHYHAALQTIELIINDLSPKVVQKEVKNEQLKDIYEKLGVLEEELPIFLGHLYRVDLNDPVKRQLLENQLAYLEEETHKINQDLRLTHDLVERVDIIIAELQKAHSFFSSF